MKKNEITETEDLLENVFKFIIEENDRIFRKLEEGKGLDFHELFFISSQIIIRERTKNK